jgi:dihydrofolate reductase
MKPHKALAAMSLNRVIGKNNSIPWHVPEDLAFFKAMTMGHILVMGRKTYESIGRPLPGRETIVLTRGSLPQVRTISHLDELESLQLDPGKDIFIAGGAQVYKATLHLCSDLYLTHINTIVEEGDTFFPPFEHLFEKKSILKETPACTIVHYCRRLS